MMQKNPYKLLQVDPEADPDVITAAYKALASQLHPDRDFTGIDEFRVAELKRAYALLMDPARRSAYDRAAQVAFPVGPADRDGAGGTSMLSRRMASKHVDSADALLTIDFGRYAGRTLGELLRADPEYLQWLSRHSSGIRYRGAIMRLLAEAEADRAPVGGKP
jgi:DnaJ-class molecular chaperone